MNYTDVGHLTSDADTGEDKIEKAAKKEHKTVSEITSYYSSIFEKDIKKLNIIPANIICKASEHIKEQLDLIKILEKKGFTYKTSDGIYFNTSKLKEYGKLGKLKIEKLQPGKRIEMGEKKNKTDFALWKFSPKNSKRQQEWDSEFGVGFPGWHLECSAMSSKYLGKQFDIHTGGEDHIQVHHTNEIAQSESAFGKKPWVKYWIHGAFLTFKGEKISKSKGGLYTISELEKLKFSPLDFRYLCLNTHYRKSLNFTLDALKNAKNSLKRLKKIISEIKDDKKINKIYLKKFEDAINNDLDIPKALSILWGLVRDKKSPGKLKTIKKIDAVFALDLLKKEKIKISSEIKKLIQERKIARKNKDYEKADEIRNILQKQGILLEDTPSGIKVKK